MTGCATVLGRTAARMPEHLMGSKLDLDAISGGLTTGDVAFLALAGSALVAEACAIVLLFYVEFLQS